MQVYKNKEKETLEVAFAGPVSGLLKELDVNPETVIVSVCGQIVGDDYELSENDDVTLFSVLSGG